MVGAGPIGAMCGLVLAERGARVAVVERGPGWGSAAVAASAGWVCPSFSHPFATRRDVFQGLRWLLARDSPLALTPSPGLLLWLGAFLLRTGPSQAAETAAALARFAAESLERHAELQSSGVDTRFEQRGLVELCETPSGFAAARANAEQCAQMGIAAEVLEPGDVAELEPGVAHPQAGAVLYPSDGQCDPDRFAQAVGGAAANAGAVLMPNRCVSGFCITPDDVLVSTSRGAVCAERAVIAAGAWSSKLARSVGARLPVVAGKGYAIDLPEPGGAQRLRHAVYLHEAKVAMTPLRDRIRAAGVLELGPLNDSISEPRARSVRHAAVRALGRAGPASGPVRVGLRPCTADGLPAIGRLDASGRMLVAAGHAMLGVTLAPATGTLLADIIDGAPEPPHFHPGRFQRAHGRRAFIPTSSLRHGWLSRAMRRHARWSES